MNQIAAPNALRIKKLCTLRTSVPYDLSFGLNGKALEGKAIAANRTREIRPSGMRGGLAETWAMGVGLRPTGKPVDKPPNPKAARVPALSRPPA